MPTLLDTRLHTEALSSPPGGEVTHKSPELSLLFPYKCPELALDRSLLLVSSTLCLLSLAPDPPL
jgi:hypothetical protein